MTNQELADAIVGNIGVYARTLSLTYTALIETGMEPKMAQEEARQIAMVVVAATAGLVDMVPKFGAIRESHEA